VRRVLIGSLSSKSSRPLIESATSNAFYANGHVLFLRDKTLMAQRFDQRALALTGQPVAMAEDIVVNPVIGTGAFTASQTGVIAYQTSYRGGTQLTWFDRTGRNMGVLGDRAGYSDVQLSRDGKRVAVTLPGEDGRTTDIWVYDVQRKVRTRLTFERESAAGPVWSPDGTRVTYSVARGSGSVIMQKAASGAGRAEVVYEDQQHGIIPLSWSHDGKFLLYQLSAGVRMGTLAVLPLERERKPYQFLNSELSEVPAALSPDGRWIAYVLTQSTGRRDVYVTTFPRPGGVWQISTSGGDIPRWRGDGREIFYLVADKLMSVPITVKGDQIEVGEAKLLFNVLWPPATRWAYDVTEDGRFLVNVADTSVNARPITMVHNWTARLK
jgi:dipeptidyl aminopeptidase/acylaminoacyl peptidase